VLNLTDPADAGNYAATWFNPRDGKEAKRSAALTATNDKCPLPARPDEGDWVLILKRGE
jgi:hypothetical protein